MRTISARVVHHEVVHKEVGWLAEQINDLRKEVDRITGKPSLDAVFDSESPLPGPASKRAFRQEFARLQREVIDLALALNQLDAEPDGGPAANRVLHEITDASAAFDIAVTGPVRNRSITIRNIGEEVVDNPRVTVNGKKQWFTTADIVDEVIDDKMSDREKALALWSFLKDNRYHDEPAHSDIEIHDPVRYLNVYGYGFCDDSATVFQALAEEAGLKARVWNLEGHVVPEAFFEGDWHVLDPDGEVYYLEEDGHTIASVETLQQRPDIIRRHPSPQYASNPEMMVQVYTTTDDNEVSEWYRKKSETLHRMDFSLRPGESIYRSWDNWGIYFSSQYLSEPKRYGNGRFVYRPTLRDGLYREGNRVEGLALATESAKSALAPDSDAAGVWIIPVQSPYPLLSGKVQIAGAIGAGGLLTLEFTEDGERWWEIARVDRQGAFEIDASTRPYLRNGHDRPVYYYQLRLTLRGSARIEQLQVESDFQHAPHALPGLETGPNRIEYRDKSSRRTVQVQFDYDLGQPAKRF